MNSAHEDRRTPARAGFAAAGHGAEYVRRVEFLSALVWGFLPVLFLVYDLVTGARPLYLRYGFSVAVFVVLAFAARRFAPSPFITAAFVAALYAGFAVTAFLPNPRGAYIVVAAVGVPFFYFIGGARVGRAASLGMMAIMAAILALRGDDGIVALHERFKGIQYLLFFAVLSFQILLAEASERRHSRSLEIIHDEHFVDEATGLPNANALSAGSLAGSETISLIRLRNIKDLRIFYDDAEGRAMASRASEILRDIARAEGARGPYRVSDAEFALVHPAGADQRAAAKSIFRAFGRSSVTGDSPLRFDVQIGSYRTGSAGESAFRAIEEAETALADCVAEDSGAAYRDRSSVTEPADDLKARAPVLVRNIGDRSLSAVFQPVYDVRRNGIGFLEALTRLRADGGLVSPESYLQTSSRLGLEKHFGDFIIEAALDMALRSGHSISINVPYRDLERPYFVDTLFRAYSSLSGKGNTIAVELTEQAAVSDYSRLRAFFAEVHEAGGLVMLDDFGTGYSNYASLLEARFDAVKVAGQIVREIAARREAAELYFGLCAFSKAAGLDVVAEHISDGAVMARALEGGAMLLQGYHFSPPLGADEILAGRLSFPDGRSTAPQPMSRLSVSSRGS
jgi:EAL domain-containing protein (putative c-di-GMP-specific phosphodiesterase class I)